eukprot:TRINITY_DN10343_c1_g1_i1.p1 TRINITY_DN10343_c1_g1~~TRINITY_DN10343_c1_g1_i1.p1  ORF type:complete len:954 (-),score=100.02 TRINITY_DN10343_c1_g1_i1:214-3075(-)
MVERTASAPHVSMVIPGLSASQNDDMAAFRSWRMHLGEMSTDSLHMQTTQTFVTNSEDEDPEDDEAEASGQDSDEVPTQNSVTIYPSSESDSEHGGLRGCAPRLYRWLIPRVGGDDPLSSVKLRIMLLFVVSTSAIVHVQEYQRWYSSSVVNSLSILVVSDFISFLIALFLSFFLEGSWAFNKVFSFTALWHWIIVAILFAATDALSVAAYRAGLLDVTGDVIGYIYTPMAAVLSFFVFSRHYGRLEWLSLTMLVLSVPAFIVLRERCRVHNCTMFGEEAFHRKGYGLSLKFVSVVVGVAASLCAERIFKERSKSINRRLAARYEDEATRHNKFYIMKVHLDFSQTLLLGMIWAAPASWNCALTGDGSVCDQWFGTWEQHHYWMVVILIARSWGSGLLVKHFSTVTKSIVGTLVNVINFCIGDAILGMASEGAGYKFSARAVPSIFIAIVALLSGVIFQTGRLNFKTLRQECNLPEPRKFGGFRSLRHYFCSKKRSPRTDSPKDPDETSLGACSFLMGYATPVLYVFGNALQTELNNVVSSNRYFVPQSLQVAIPLCGMCFAMFLTWKKQGRQGLKEAWNPKKLWKFWLLGSLQAITLGLAGMAMGLGINSSLYVAMGKIYTPLSLFLGCCMLKNRYLWIEWLSVAILFVASLTLALLDTVGPKTEGSKSKGSSLAAVMCVFGSATMSCVFSVLMERLLKEDKADFVVHKIRLDFGALCWGAAFLPVMGYLGDWGGRPDLAYWNYRPNPYWKCKKLGSCDANTGAFLWLEASAEALARSGEFNCVCGNGVFLGWDQPSSWVIYLALSVGVLYSWVTGQVVRKYSTVMRSVFDGYPIILLWFVITPLASHMPFAAFKAAYYEGPLPWFSADWAKDLMTIVNPVSAVTYVAAAAEVRKVMQLRWQAAQKAQTDISETTSISTARRPSSAHATDEAGLDSESSSESRSGSSESESA